MSKFQIIFIGFFVTIFFSLSGLPAFAEDLKAPFTDPQQDAGTFGNFEVGLPGLPKEYSIDRLVGTPDPILQFINLAVNAVIAVLVIIGLITIVIGGYTYMTAAGDASKVKTAKEMIIAALAGIFLSLVSVIILNTINSYLGKDAQEPKLGPSPAAGPGSGGGGSSNSSALAPLQAELNGYNASINEIKVAKEKDNISLAKLKAYNAELVYLEQEVLRVEGLIDSLP